MAESILTLTMALLTIYMLRVWWVTKLEIYVINRVHAMNMAHIDNFEMEKCISYDSIPSFGILHELDLTFWTRDQAWVRSGMALKTKT